MLKTYQGLLRLDRIVWDRDAPEHLSADRPVRVHVTLLEPGVAPSVEQSQRMAEALARLAALRPEQLPQHPDEWQRETREDRPLPGRDE
jgi:hypothetical protein